MQAEEPKSKKTRSRSRRKNLLRFMHAMDQNWICPYCTKPLTWSDISLDHINPISRSRKDWRKRHRTAVRSWPLNGKYFATHRLCNWLRGTYNVETVLSILENPKRPSRIASGLKQLWYLRHCQEAERAIP